MTTQPVWCFDDEQNHLAEWPGDPALAEINQKISAKAPKSRILHTDILATAYNIEQLEINDLERIVDLDCSHKVVTKNFKTCHCPICQAMVDRGADFDSFEQHLRENGYRGYKGS